MCQLTAWVVSKIPAKQRKINVTELVDTICSHAYESGIPTDALSTAIDVVTLEGHLDQGSKTTLIKNLYPASNVPNDVVFRVVGALGPSTGKPSAVTQALLVKWLILVYEVLADSSVLSKLYAVLFNLLDMISLRLVYPVHLRPGSRLSRLQRSVVSFAISHHSSEACETIQDPDAVSATSALHVSITNPCRLELCSSMAPQPALVGFLRVFKDYYPDVIVGNATAGRASYFFVRIH